MQEDIHANSMYQENIFFFISRVDYKFHIYFIKNVLLNVLLKAHCQYWKIKYVKFIKYIKVYKTFI